MVWGCVARAFVTKKRQAAELAASQVVTALVRGHTARQLVSARRREVETAGARRLQALLRGHCARKRVGWMLIQWMDEERLTGMERSAMVIQGFVQGSLARRFVKRMRTEAENAAASRIQGKQSRPPTHVVARSLLDSSFGL